MLRSWAGKERLGATAPAPAVRAEDLDPSIGDWGHSPVELIDSEQTQTPRHRFPTDKQDQFRPTCTVVICTRNRPTELNRCLEAVAHLDYPHFDVLVVDNAPSDDQARRVAMRWGAGYLIQPAPGLSRARNLGALACTAEVVAYLDDDSLPEPNWIFMLMQEFKDPLVMAVTGSTKALKVETEAERLCALMATSHSNGHGRRVIDCRTPHWFEIANFGGVGDGMNMAFRRKAFEIWTGFDERLGRGALIDGGEEHYAFFSLLELGYRVAYTPHAVVRHPFPRDMQELRRRNFQDLASATAYITLFFIEQPRHRGALMRYVVEAIQGKPRTWRNSAGQSRPIIASRPRRLLAWLCGPLLYAQSRFARRPAADSLPQARLSIDRFVAQESKGE